MPREFEAPNIDWAVLTPVLWVLGTAALGILILGFLPRAARWAVQAGMAVVGLLAALVSLLMRWDDQIRPVGTIGDKQNPTGFLLSIIQDRPSLMIQIIIVVLALLSVLVMVERGRGDDAFAPSAAAVPGSAYEAQARAAGVNTSEVFPLVLFAVGGMMVFAAAGDFLTLFIALEVFSLPLYILTGLAARRRLISQEAGLKYFLLGAFASGFLLFGMATLWMTVGTLSFADLSQRSLQPGANLDLHIVVAVVMIFMGVLFKIGAVPFHVWTPDVYEGAPTPVTGFMAACTKVAAFGALLRILFGLNGLATYWQPILATAAAASMVFGAVVALRQTSMKRVLAYSSIAHAGFILAAFMTLTDKSVSAVLFYLTVYGLTTVGAFAVVALVREEDADGNVSNEASAIQRWAGLGRRSPLLAGAFTLFLLAMAGIPLTSGFIGKFAVFQAAVTAGYAWLAIIGVLSSAVAAFFYIRIVVSMYSTPEADRAEVASIAHRRPLTLAAVMLTAIATLALGVFPSPLLDMAQDATTRSLSVRAEQAQEPQQ